MTTPRIFLKAKEEGRILQGHLWVFSNEIEKLEGQPQPGAIVDITTHRGKFLGKGFYNSHSLISFRLLTTADEEINSSFFSKKIAQAKRFRENIFPNESSYRLIFGESDSLPGLVIDRYGDCFVCQSYCLGMDRLLKDILIALNENFNVKCIIKKNDSSLRALEGLKEEVEVIQGEVNPPLPITQTFNGKELMFYMDPIQGQKTGFFLDQRENRERLQFYTSGKRLLDCFSYVGAFGVYGALCGAKEVTCVESSTAAVQLIEKNFQQNGFKSEILQEDVPAALERLHNEKRKFDIIVLDPPALTKSKRNLFSAIRKYKHLNSMAINLLESGGLLMSSSCSHHLSREDFLNLLNEAGAVSGRRLKLLEMRGQSRDHPVLLSMPETDYLKCAIVQVD